MLVKHIIPLNKTGKKVCFEKEIIMVVHLRPRVFLGNLNSTPPLFYRTLTALKLIELHPIQP